MSLLDIEIPKEFGWYDDNDFPSLKGMNIWLMSGETQPNTKPYLIVVTDKTNNDWEYGLPISIENEFEVLEEFSESNKVSISNLQEVALRSWIRAYKKELMQIWNGNLSGIDFCNLVINNRNGGNKS